MPTRIRILTAITAVASIQITASAQTTTFPGNVGIGTTTPTTALHISSNTPSILLQDTVTSGKTYSLSSRWGGYFTIFDENDPGQARLSINPNGTIGIGMTIPGFKLDVKNDNFNAIRATGNSSNSVGIYVQNTISSGRQWGLLSSGGGPAPVGSFGIWDDAAGLRFTINDSGNVGMGTPSPDAPLEVHKAGSNVRMLKISALPVTAGSHYSELQFGIHDDLTANGAGMRGYFTNYLGSYATDLRFFTSNSGNVPSENFVLKGDTGNVGIGTTNPTHKLAVNGTIKAKEVIVETTAWSDYVFADGYALAPLTEVEAHIKEHKHLPGIPSAAQVAEQGVSVGDMQAKLLAKIEELTLHQIAQEKRALAQEARAAEQDKELTALRAQISELRSNRP